jgi:predicted nucleic acid-binding protein
MSVFADTNWLESLYFKPSGQARPEARARHAIVERRMRRLTSPLVISPIVLLEARNVFSRLAGNSKPLEWEMLLGDFNDRILLQPMNWDALQHEACTIFERLSHKTTVGTLDATIAASARLAGARELLSFDERLKAIAACLGIGVFPPLAQEGRMLLAQLRR